MRQKDNHGLDNQHSGPPWLPHLFYLIITAVLAIPVINTFGNWGVRDWDLFTTLNAASVRSIVEYGQFPFWNPYIGGGNILFAHPEVAVLHPLFILLLLFGPLIGLKIQMLLMYLVGMIGFYKLSRQIGISYWGAFLPPIVFMLSSYLTLHFAAGHVPFHYFAVFPWLMFFYKKSLDKPIHILTAGAIVGFFILGSGAAVPFLFSGFFLLLFSIFDIGERNKFKPPFYVLSAFVCGLLFSAVKFFPMFDYLSRHPWVPEEGILVTTPINKLFDIFFNFDQSVFSQYLSDAQFAWGWHEYGTFIGPVAGSLALIGLLASLRKRWPYLVLTIAGVGLAMGSFMAPYSPWDLLHQLPGFQSMRVPSRFSLLTLICVSVMAGYGLDYLLAKFRSRKGLLSMAAFIMVLGTHLFVCLPILGEAFPRPPEHVEQSSDFKQIEGDPNQLYSAFLSNRGTILAAWLSAYRHGCGIMGYNGQTMEWYSDNDAVWVIKRQFSPNRIGFEVETVTGGTLIISQGYDPGWRAVDDREIKSRSDLVSFNVLPADKSIEIYYFPDYYLVGAVISVLSLLASITGIYYYLRSRK